MDIPPLTHCNAAGEVYQRSPEVENEILSATEMEDAALIERARNSDEQDALYLHEETLVFLIRHASIQGRLQLVSDLASVLCSRCTPLVRARLGHQPDFESRYADVIGDLFTMIADFESDRGDFLQVRFWRVLDRLVATTFRMVVKESTFDQRIERDREDGDDNGKPNADERVAQPGLSLEKQILLRDALAQLPEPQRTAFLLRFYHGWPIEDQDPTMLTISRYFQKTSRTIRNWLRTAEDSLRMQVGGSDD